MRLSVWLAYRSRLMWLVNFAIATRLSIVIRSSLAFRNQGETADTLAALREARRKGAFVRGIVNVVGSPSPAKPMAAVIFMPGKIGSRFHQGIYQHDCDSTSLCAAIWPPESSQCGHRARLLYAMREIQPRCKRRSKSDRIREIARKYSHHKNFLFVSVAE